VNSLQHTFSLGTFSVAGCAPFAGLVLGERVVALHGLGPLARSCGVRLTGTCSVIELLQDCEANFAALQRIVPQLLDEKSSAGAACRALLADVARLTVHPPVNLPRQILCSGANYRKHVIDLIIDQGDPASHGMSPDERRAYAGKLMDERAAKGEPFFFSKMLSAVTGPNDPIVLADFVRQPDWELELGVVIGRSGHNIRLEEALDHVAGYTIANDITNREMVFRRDLKALGADWVAAKGMPSYLPTGPYLVPKRFVPNPQDLRLTLKLNGRIMQDESTADMIFGVARLIEHVSRFVQLWPGDLICTGSPAGNGSHYDRFLRPGDLVESTITGLGVQRNAVMAEQNAPSR